MGEVIEHRGVTMHRGQPEALARAQRLRTYTRDGVSHERVAYGFDNPAWGESPCSGCGAIKGELHVPDCEYELCPFCNESLASGCSCPIAELAEPGQPAPSPSAFQRGLDSFERWAIRFVVAGLGIALIALLLWLWRSGLFGA